MSPTLARNRLSAIMAEIDRQCIEDEQTAGGMDTSRLSEPERMWLFELCQRTGVEASVSRN